jgi:hypothetical protein
MRCYRMATHSTRTSASMAWLAGGRSSLDSMLSFRAPDPISVRLCGHLPRECCYLHNALHYASMLCPRAWNSAHKYSATSNFLDRALRYFQNGFPTLILSLFYFCSKNLYSISQLELLGNKEIGPHIRVAAGTSRSHAEVV